LIGNGVATVVVAKMEKEFHPEKKQEADETVDYSALPSTGTAGSLVKTTTNIG